MTRFLSASRLNDFLGCAHQSALWLAGVKPDPKDDPTLDLVRAKGFEHEAGVLAALEAELGAAVSIEGKAPLEARVAATLAAIKSGAPLIYQGALADESWMGLPDYLIRRPVDGGRYEAEDAKLAHRPKAEHVLQLALYAELLEKLVGDKVGEGVIRVAGGPPVTFDLRAFRFILRRLMRDFERFTEAPEHVTRAIPCKVCRLCDYQARCEGEWRAADSVFFVAGVSFAQVLKLEAAGVATLTALATAPPQRVAGMADETVARLSAQARLQLQARETRQVPVETLPLESGRGFHLMPAPNAGDLYFDMEGYPLVGDGLEYLFGLWGPIEGAEATFRGLWAHNADAEKSTFEELIDLFARHFERYTNAHIYHYAQYEPSALKRLAMRYATREAELDQMLRDRRFVDLYAVVRQGLRAGVESYSLKEIEKIYEASRGGAVTTAADSIVQYERWRTTGDDAILASIERYNKDDCVSTAHLHAWLEKLRPAAAHYQIVGETARDEPEKVAERTAREVRKRAVAAQVRASSIGDPAVRELVAELLWFHQRALKPGYWAMFERQSWSNEKLVEDADSLGALTRDTSVVPIPDRRSFLTTFRFPPQDTKLKLSETPRIAATLANAGKIVELDPEAGRVVLRRSAKAGALPSLFSLIPSPLGRKELPDAVLAFAERFSASTLHDDQALMDFLLRLPPNLKGRARGAPIATGTADLVDEIVRAVNDLDASTLFVQGPPGSGKTYTISKVVVDLLRKGHRVGVASNSHRAINKVLEEIEERAEEQCFNFCGVKKGREDEPETYFDSLNIDTVVKSEDVQPYHTLVGGTAYHFARDDQRNAYDYLIVDEAGQVSLGNLVAMAGAGRNLVLVGDQMQLSQPIQGMHPGETGVSCLDYLLAGAPTVPAERGVLLNESRRMHPDICAFISEAIYEGRLHSHPDAGGRFLVLSETDATRLQTSGIVFVRTRHEGSIQSSPEEGEVIADLAATLKRQSISINGVVRPLEEKDILVVAPYNMQVKLLRELLPEGIAVGTVDKFQGQEAPVVILSMTTSRGSEAPRGTAFLFNKNRLNVALSRAQCLAIVVHNETLLDGAWSQIEDLKRLNLFAHAEASAALIVSSYLR